MTDLDRQDRTFGAGDDTCAAWLHPAETDSTMAPIVVMAHGLSGTRRDRLRPFARRFAAAGIAALVFDHRGFGDSTGEQDRFEPARQLEDWRAAIAFARALPGIDSAIAAARQAPRGELRTYPGIDHFDIYDGPPHDAVVRDEVEFLGRHLLGRASSHG